MHARGFENPLPRTESPGLAQLIKANSQLQQMHKLQAQDGAVGQRVPLKVLQGRLKELSEWEFSIAECCNFQPFLRDFSFFEFLPTTSVLG
jgi:hypothetical protein